MKPKIVTVGRKAVTVVESKPTYWVEDNGAVHLGRLLDGQAVLKFLDDPKPCSRCKTPALTATTRGRAHHVQCEGWLDRLPDQSENQIVFGIAADLNAIPRKEK